MLTSINIGNSDVHPTQPNVTGKFVHLLGELYYCIENYDGMAPFFMSVVSHSDHWTFISSTGGLTAGRINAESALFPYETDDKVTESYPHTGPHSLFFVTHGGPTWLWEPFSDRDAGLYSIERRIYKNISGNKLIFEETNRELALTYRRAWRTSDRFGFVLTTWLQNQSEDPLQIRLLSGVQNILPYGVTTRLQSTFSNLLNAYKRGELDPESGLGIFSLSSTITDLAEPSESLQATTAWQVGLEDPLPLLSSTQVKAFRKGAAIRKETDMRGVRGAYLLSAEVRLAGQEEKEWSVVLDVNQDSADIAALRNLLQRPPEEIAAEIERDIALGSQALNALIASADGIQLTGDRLSSVHHYTNVLFNIMRGGVFAAQYQVEKADLIDYLQTRNREVLERHRAYLHRLPAQILSSALLASAGHQDDPVLERLCFEYLPLTFSRRHGDPSRPWNKFSINIKNPDSSQRLDYQGNWRDIFQNWEALACSYPEYVENMIAIFANAGTPDGYNPYRVTRNGVEWEVPEPENPWSNIGYWSDHQIIYLQKLLEISSRYHPGKLDTLLTKRIFSYVSVPYRLHAYTALLEDPYKTIDFDPDLHREIEARVATLGSDGKLVRSVNGDIFHVNLSEKLLLFLLAKLVNFVPQGGIWMNTQRPEWNDANNALVGKGLSVVTLGYLRRYVLFWQTLLERVDWKGVRVSREVKSLFDSIYTTLSGRVPDRDGSFSDEERRTVMDALGQAGSDYRWHLYRGGFSGEFERLPVRRLKTFLEITRQWIDHSLQANRRADGLFHAYNILNLGQQTATISSLVEMLEGQVSILSSGFLSSQEALDLLRCLRKSPLYRADQHSYILYPDRTLPAFIRKNCLPSERTQEIDLVGAMVKNNETSLIVRDENGAFHFNGSFRNARDVREALERLRQQESYADLVAADGEKILALFEEVFQHDQFTGRSGRFFAYEGLGSIYWHMVSKLLLAVQENTLLAVAQEANSGVLQGLAGCYSDIRQGLGFNKSPGVYGAFPMDPYSHTPKDQGAKQPGMTGQVKEEILTRQVELGLLIKEGQIAFHPILLRSDEFLTGPAAFSYVNLKGEPQQIQLSSGSLAFTFCQTPVVYQLGEKPAIRVHFTDGKVHEISGACLDVETSQHIFKRDAVVDKIVVSLQQTE